MISVVALLRTAWVVIYRIYFHPLAKVPGPLLARITWLYSFWYNIVTKRFYLRVQELHEQYGPVIRITPDEIHLSDPENLEKIYFVGSRYPKDAAFYGAFGADRSVFTAPSPDVHRVKRAALNPFFSRKKVLELEDIVQDKAEKLVGRMKKAFNSTGAIDLHHGFRAISVDVITDYAFGDSYNFLDRDDFGIDFFNGFRDTGPALWTFQQFPVIQRVAKKMPFWLAERLSAPLALRRSQHMSSRAQVLKVKAAVERDEKVSRTTIFHELLCPDAAEGYAVPNVDELSSEAQNILGAASDTTGNTLTIAAYNVVRNPDIYARLSAELKEAFPNPEGRLEFVALEKLPYLTAVIKEGLR